MCIVCTKFSSSPHQLSSSSFHLVLQCLCIVVVVVVVVLSRREKRPSYPYGDILFKSSSSSHGWHLSYMLCETWSHHGKQTIEQKAKPRTAKVDAVKNSMLLLQKREETQRTGMHVLSKNKLSLLA